MTAGARFAAEQSIVVIRRSPAVNADKLSQLQKGDEIIAAEVVLEEGVEWVRVAKGSRATRVNGVRKQVSLDLVEDGFVPMESKSEGVLLRKMQTQVVVEEMREEGALSKADIAAILEKSSDPGMILPLESKYWTKEQLSMYVMSGGTIRPRWCSIPDERLMANTNMSKEEIVKALTKAAEWISNADAILIGSGAGMGVDSGLGTFRGSHKGVWQGLEDVGLAYEEICNPKWFQDEPHLAWGFWDFCHGAYQASTPHNGYAVARGWAQRCPLGFFSFTSNIDSHWITSGTSSERVLEVHGAVRWLQCSRPCCPDVWRAPKDLGLTEDSETHRVRGVLPTCPKCKAVARPNVQMFGGDSGFSKARRSSQFGRYDSWLKALEARPDTESLRVTCIEIGCGLTVPTVRNELETVVRKFPGARIIRVNPENPGLDTGLVNKGVSLPLRAGVAIDELGKQVVNEMEDSHATFIMWDHHGGGCEIKAPHRICLGRLIRLAEKEGIPVEFSRETCGRSIGFGAFNNEEMTLDRSVPIKSFCELKEAQGSTLGVATCLHFSNLRFKDGLNPALAKRIEEVKALLDDMNALFAEKTYQEDVRKCPDKRGVMRMTRQVHFQVLPRHGFEDTEKGTHHMTNFISYCQAHHTVNEKVDQSMDLSYVKHMGHLPNMLSNKSKEQEKAKEREKEREQAPAEKPEKPVEPPQPIEVTLICAPNEDGNDLGLEKVVPDLTNKSTIAELRKTLVQAFKWEESLVKKMKFLSKTKGNFFTFKEDEFVRKVLYVTNCPQLQKPEAVQANFIQMAPEEGEEPNTFQLEVMTSDIVTDLRSKLSAALGWDQATTKQAKFLIKMNSHSFGGLKEHERVNSRKVIYVHGAPLALKKQTPVQPDPFPQDETDKSATKSRSQPAAQSQTQRSIDVVITRLGTQEDPQPDSMTLTMSSNQTVSDLRKKMAAELGLDIRRARDIKFIANTSGKLVTMREFEKVRPQIMFNSAGIEGRLADKGQAPQHAQQTNADAPKDNAEPLLVSVLIHGESDFSVDVPMRIGMTMGALKQKLADMDPTGNTKSDSFELALIGHPDVLKSTDRLTKRHAHLEIRTPQEQEPNHQAATGSKTAKCENHTSSQQGAEAQKIDRDSYVYYVELREILLAMDKWKSFKAENPQLCQEYIQRLASSAWLRSHGVEKIRQVLEGSGFGSDPAKSCPVCMEFEKERPDLALTLVTGNSRPLNVTVTRMGTHEDEVPQTLAFELTTLSRIGDLRVQLQKACQLTDRQARALKILFHMSAKGGKNGFMTAKENEKIISQMYVHGVDRWPE